MVGIVMVSHCNLAPELHKTLETVMGVQQNLESVGLHPGESKENFKLRVAEAVSRVNSGNGVLILADLFGGTPCNACFELMGSEFKNAKIDVITGLNLPMAVQACRESCAKNLKELVDIVKKAARDSVMSYSDMLMK
ncbi:PTS sugar transporter subunit IIA [Thermosediminibacter oceani]|uniref:PTS system fructose subfamily IIA component n=1 Tax=Thermosediminibacter oceani (strain ATCC BAA-1034 / DSM 16646 / JW/IW-1228P) TaxID=555079 RepID=D9S1R0_THEOJ|nr:PTS sugar transporter subunit IIA [Thermosediminibacter oceani]ADL07337.1 PTS system fructose subfamily IIA component [Thermosediminibacter oceani DSM 16646]